MINDESRDEANDGAADIGTCQTGCGAEKPAKKYVVSKRTKLLFIAFGAVSIAAIAIVWGPDFDKDNLAKAQAPAKTQSAVPAPAKNAR